MRVTGPEFQTREVNKKSEKHLKRTAEEGLRDVTVSRVNSQEAKQHGRRGQEVRFTQFTDATPNLWIAYAALQKPTSSKELWDTVTYPFTSDCFFSMLLITVGI